MDVDDANPTVLARCARGLRLTFDEFSQTCHAFMRDLVALHSGFEGLSFVRAGDPRRHATLQPDLSNLDEGLQLHGWSPNLKQYSDVDAQGRPTRQSQGYYHLLLSNWRDVDHKVDVSVRMSPVNHLPSTCVIDLPGPSHPEFRSRGLSLDLLGVVFKHWPVRYASYAPQGWNRRFNWSLPENERAGCFEIGWHTFVDDPRVAEALPADVTVQRVGTGILFTLFDEMPDVNDPATVERARDVRARLAEAGWLKLPLA